MYSSDLIVVARTDARIWLTEIEAPTATMVMKNVLFALVTLEASDRKRNDCDGTLFVAVKFTLWFEWFFFLRYKFNKNRSEIPAWPIRRQ